MLTFLYIDDIGDDLKTYSELLTSSSVRVRGLPPTGNPLDVSQSLKPKPDLCLLDYDLARQVAYQGSTLAGLLRDHLPEVPIVLLTRKRLAGRPKLGELSEIFDDVLFKSDMKSSPTESRRILMSLSRGFAKLRRIRDKNWQSVLTALGATDAEADLLLRSGPPLKESGATTAAWSARQVARWIRRVILRFPGVVYEQLNAATALGITSEAMNRHDMQRLFASARYSGIFSGEQRLWWKGRLLATAQRVITNTGKQGPTYQLFASAFNAGKRSKVSTAVCNTSGKTPADCLCYVLRTPVLRECSLPYYPDDRPAVMDEARVSFKAIREDNRVLEELFDDHHRRLLQQIQEAGR